MSGTIDERIVEMQFQGSSFLEGVKNTVTALENLKNKLNALGGADNDINKLDNAGKNFSLSKMGDSVDSVKSKFTAMGIVGLTVLSNIVNRAVNVGVNLLKAVTIDPIKAGLASYETKINAIQTILANTATEGTKLPQVTAALANLNQYANLTVYNFAEMTRNIGTFTAAGVDLQTSVSSIKGIANLAALSGSSAEQASSAMYQLSQAIAAGKVKLQDWNSVVNAGIGGKVFQNALEQTAKATGVNIDAIVKKAGGFRNSLQEGWLSTKILTQTLSTFTGDLSNAQLRAMGYTEAQTVAIQKQAKIALQSATQIRTISQLTAAVQDDASTAWASVWEAIIGNINTAPKVLTAVFNILSSALTKPAYGIANMIDKLDQLGGRQDIIKAFSNAFQALSQILGIIGHAWSVVFPPETATDLLKIAYAIEKFTGSLFLTNTGIEDLTTISVGFFSFIKLIVDVIKGFGTALDQIGASTKSAGNGLLGLVADVAQWISNVKNAVENGTALNTFFTDLGKVIAVPIKGIGLIVSALGGFTGIVNKAADAAKPFVTDVGSEFSKLAGAIAAGIKSGDFENVTAIINQVLFGGVLVSIRKFISGITGGADGEKTGFFATIKESFESLTGTLKTMQQTLKSETLEKIAIAVALLSVSLIALSFINVKKLGTALGAISIMFVQLLAAMAVISKIAGSGGVVKMVAVGVALNILAVAIVILAGAVAILAQFSWGQLTKGLSAIAILLTELVIATALMGGNAKGLVASAYSMEVMAIALNILAAAVGKLGKLDFGTLAKGLGAVAILLLELGIFTKLAGGEGLISTAVAMLILGAALEVIADVVKKLGSLSTGQLVKGLVGIAAALLIIAGAMYLMPPDMILTAASLLLVATSLVILSKALSTMGALSWVAIAKSLILLAASLAIIAIAMILMTEALPGALALIVVAAALAILAPVLVALSKIGWEGIAEALVTLVGVFVILGAAGIVLTPLIPSLLGIGLAVTLLGVGLLAAGAGVFLFATGLTLLAAAVTASGAAILSFVTNIIGIIPDVLKQLGLGVLAFASVIGNGAPALVKAVVALLSVLLTGIIKVIPLAVKALETLLNAVLKIVPEYEPKLALLVAKLILNLLDTIAVYYPKFVVAAIQLVVNLLNGIANEIPKVAAAAVRVVIAFINAIVSSELAIARAGANAVISLINGIANEINRDTPRLREAGINLAGAIINGMTLGLVSDGAGFLNKIFSLGSSAVSTFKSAIESLSPSKAFARAGETIPQGIVVGVEKRAGEVNDSMTTVGTNALNAMKDSLSGFNDILSGAVDLNPTITPVLDLTQATKGFNALSGMSKSQLINATASTSKATSISATNAAAAEAAGVSVNGGNNLTFNQYNTSPVALSNIDIYRQTKNQLSAVKGALAPNANVG